MAVTNIKRLRSFLTGVIVCVGYCTTIPLHAQYFTGAVAEGVGGAGVAANDQSESYHLNPAVLVHAKGFSLGGFYRAGPPTEVQDDHVLGATFVDNTDGVYIPGGLSYIQRERKFNDSETSDEEYFHGSMAHFLGGQVSVGLSIKHLRSVYRGEKHNLWNGDFGVLWAPVPWFGWGLVYYNFVKEDDSVPLNLENGGKFRTGTHVILNDFVKYRLDLERRMERNDHDRWVVKSGLESNPWPFVSLRVGYDQDFHKNQSFLTTGMSFNGPRFRLDYSYRKQQGEGAGAMHGVDLRVPF